MLSVRLVGLLWILCFGMACGGGASPNGTPTTPTPSPGSNPAPTTTTTTVPPAPAPGTNPAVMGTLTARIDGVSFAGVNLVHAVLDDKSATPTLTVQGWGPGPQSEPAINLLLRPRVGTVNIVAPDLTFITIASLATGSTVWSASQATRGSSGTVTITALRPRVVGTFEFVGLTSSGSPASRRITEGRFDIQACDPPCLFDPIK